MTKERKLKTPINMILLIEYGMLLGEKHSIFITLYFAKKHNAEHTTKLRNELLEENNKLLQRFKDKHFKDINLRVDIERFEEHTIKQWEKSKEDYMGH